MGDSFKLNWRSFQDEVLKGLSEYGWDEPLSQDIFVALSNELLVSSYKTIGKDAWIDNLNLASFKEHVELIETEENKDNALNLMCELFLPEEVPDSALLRFIESSIELLRDEYDESLGIVFSDLVSNFIEKYNLSYRLTPDGRLIPLICQEMRAIYDRITVECGPYNDMQGLWCDFEESYASLVKGQADDFKTPLAKAALFLEAMAADFGGASRSEKFSIAIKQFEKTKKFPHKGSISRSILGLYGLASNYPGIRHAGEPDSKTRDLVIQDVNHLGLMFLVWAGYMHCFKELENG